MKADWVKEYGAAIIFRRVWERLGLDRYLNWKEIVLAYKDLWQVEAAFRMLKSGLEMGPIYHWTGRRIRAHIFVCAPNCQSCDIKVRLYL